MLFISSFRASVFTYYACKVLPQKCVYFLEIAFTLRAPIFQCAQILDDRQSTTLSTSFKCWVFQDLFINVKHVIENKSTLNN